MSLSTSLTGLTEAVALAIGSLRASKARAALTILGVAIGVFVVVIMSAAIHGINQGVATAFESAGPTTFFLSRFPITLVSSPAHQFLNSSFVNVGPLQRAAREPEVSLHPHDAERRAKP